MSVLTARKVEMASSSYRKPIASQSSITTQEPFLSSSEGPVALPHLMQSYLQAKDDNRTKALKNRGGAEDIIVVGNDIATTGFLVFEGIKAINPASQSLFGVFLATTLCGVIGGLINFGEGIVGIKEAIEAFRCGDTKLAWRQLISAIFTILIGAAMILEALAPILGIGFFAANPWVLPIVFFLGILPVFKEVFERSMKILRGKDYGSQLQLDKLKEGLNSGKITTVDQILEKYQELNPHLGVRIFDTESLERILSGQITDEERYQASVDLLMQILEHRIEKEKNEDDEADLKMLQSKKFHKFSSLNQQKINRLMEKLVPQEIDITQLVIMHKLYEKMEKFQANMGVDAAIEAFSFFTYLVNEKLSGNSVITEEKKQKILTKVAALDTKIHAWQRVQHLRLFVQFLLTGSFVFGWFASNLLFDAINSFVMAAANGLPLYIDAMKPFDRDTNVVVPKADIRKVSQIYAKKQEEIRWQQQQHIG